MRQRCVAGTLSIALGLIFGFCSLGSQVHAQATQVKPWFLVLVDTSGSMCQTSVSISNSCGFPKNIKMNAAKCALQNILNSTGDAEFGLEQFTQNANCGAAACVANSGSGYMRVGISATGAASILPLVDGVGAPANDCDTNGQTPAAGDNTAELCSGGGTPIGGSLQKAREYFNGTNQAAGGMTAPTRNDANGIGCRPISVILLTDGMENCTASAPADAAALLSNTYVPRPAAVGACTTANANCVLAPIKTYAIGFGISSGDAAIEAIATSGGTDNQSDGAGGVRGYYASNEAALSSALTQIILDSQLTETCDGGDNDCDGRVDEGYAKYCDVNGIRTSNPAQSNLGSYGCTGMTCTAVPGEQDDPACAQPEWSSSSTCSPSNLLCTSPGEICNQQDDDCDGIRDEGAPPLIGVEDGCDLVDSDCDGAVDEDCIPGSCGPEICDNDDDDCDGNIDENLSRRCGTDVGACVAGSEVCATGVWGACTNSTGPGVETCNNIDDDCDGIVDHITRACTPYGSTLECLAGVETCIGGVWQSTKGPGAGDDDPSQCIGARGPTPDICDLKNNDCNVGTADGSGDSRVGQSCGNSKGICEPGTTVCTAGNVVCSDVDESSNEVCDGFDNDCDGTIDENTVGDPLPGVGVACTEDLVFPAVVIGECETGLTVCLGGDFVCQGFTGPTTEICDTLDNDCNASTADGSADPRVGQSCGTGTGECEPGSNICSAGAITCDGGQGPVFELCDGDDNDCDFKTDEDLPDTNPTDGMLDADTDCDVAGGLGDEGACELGNERCVQTGPNTWAIQCTGGVGPSLETCDGEDNDCDGQVDECAGDHASQDYIACVAGSLRGTDYGPLGAGGGKVCPVGEAVCDTGLTKCVEDIDPSNGDATEPGYICVGFVPGDPEICNNLDDDCDTKIDEDLDPDNDPRLEQECDDDAQGVMLSIPSCREQNDPTEPCGLCKFGQTACDPSSVDTNFIVCVGAIGPTFESCNGSDDDCDGTVDECVDPNGDNCSDPDTIDPDTQVGEECASGACQAGVNQCVDGVLTCVGVVSGVDELCNNLDDDCDDNIDEGFNKGAPCTASGMEAVGECRPGMIACDPGGNGGVTCVNEQLPVEEICNSLDDDCDRLVDEGLGLGDACGTDVGLCRPGQLECVTGRTVCTGELGPQPETCDCEDNDCDGKIDEDSTEDPVCPVGQCVMCQCALPCADSGEFAIRCPQGKAPVDTGDGCFCVGEQCNAVACQAETIEVDGQDRCAPDSDKVGKCMCKNNECTFRCAGVECQNGLVCDPTDGSCKRATCLLQQFSCPEGERCSLGDNAWECVGDECATKDCEADQACRDGDCIASCATVTCGSNERCVDGACQANPCVGVNCEAGNVCDPSNGDCVPEGECVASGCGDGLICDKVGGTCGEDPCLRTHCPYAQTCNKTSGQCELRCFGNLLFCDDECVNPTTSRVHCGASDDCLGDNAGKECDEGLVCSQGECSSSCTGGFVNCGGECIDPKIDQKHCGASGECTGDGAGTLCRAGYACTNGECLSVVAKPGTGGTGSEQSDNGKDVATRVLASGGGGCACSVPGTTQPSGSRHGWPAVLLLGLIASVLRRRRLLASAASAAAASGFGARRRVLFAACMIAVFVLLGSGCKVEPFCLDCPTKDKPTTQPKSDGGADVQGGTGGSTGTGGTGTQDGGPNGDGSVGDGSVPRPDGGCLDEELCNGIDDDCDGTVDEDVDPAAVNIDVKTDVVNCGKCGNVCSLPHAFNKCVAGECEIDPDQGSKGCDVGFHDLDGNVDNGCEYRCTGTSPDDSVCDLLDGDCDGNIDEDVDLETDTSNCGSCGFRCSFPHATGGSECQARTCVLDDTKCDDGYVDVDDRDSNGCEYTCTPDGEELCDFIDNDCDGTIDEGVADTDDRVGDKCGSPEDDPDKGECTAGRIECQSGVLACVGAVGPTLEVCDGLDNDCDGVVDTDDPNIGLPCNAGMPGSECSPGVYRIPGGEDKCDRGAAAPLECFGGQGPVDELCDALDNDCDGKVDEAVAGVKPEENQKCVNGSNGIQILDEDPPEWTAATLCRTGTTSCVSGSLVCRNEIAPAAVELCDDIDQDCDGDPLNGYTFVSGVAATGADQRIGDACGSDIGECASGTLKCHQSSASLVCDDQTLPAVEACNGKDDDCDGQTDEVDALTQTPPTGVGLACTVSSLGVMQYGSGVTALSPCEVGTTICVAGNIACPDYVGPTAELCDGIDQDCDGVLAETSFPADTRINASCDTDSNTTGVCNTGTQYCDTSGTPQIRCQGETFASADLCDGLDNDCNASTADGSAESWIGDDCHTESNGTIDLTPSPLNGTCELGVAACVAGLTACVGEVGPQLETCDSQVPGDLTDSDNDQDCDGNVDEDFLLSTNTARCGTCSHDCAPEQPNANMACVSGACQISSCKANYYDDKNVPGTDCSLHDPEDCNFTGQEICDGSDNDCDGRIDETSVGEPIFLPDPTLACLQLGACATSTTVCRTHKVGDLDNVSCTGTGDPTCITEPVCTVRPTDEVCDAPYNAETSSTYDNDCDGVSDSVEFGLTTTCNAAGVGACATSGNLACNLTTVGGVDTRCVNGSGNPVTTGTAGTESTCNNTDDDCDGDVDEACGLVGSDANCVTDNWVTLPSGAQIYAYEASRPDASDTGSGTNNSRACSVAGRLPWGNLTWDEAEAACEATDPNGRLCTEEQWQEACQVVDGSANTCTWSYSTYAANPAAGCNTYSASTCNGYDFTPPSGDPIEPTGYTGTGVATSSCYRPHGAANVFDQSGNVKEYVDERLDGTLPVRGGAYNNTSGGIACGFNFTVWPNQGVAKFPNVGFRCCRGPCVTYTSTDTPLTGSNGADVTSTITVANSGITTISDISVRAVGTNNDIDDVTLSVIHGATTRTLVDITPCSNNQDLPYSLAFSDYGATPTVSGNCDFLSNGRLTKPGQTLGAFTGAANGTWQLRAADNDGGETNVLTSWSLRICGQ